MNVPRPEKNEDSAFARPAGVRWRSAAVRPRWGALAGSILAGVLVGAWLWGGWSGDPLTDDVLSHLEGEAAALAAGGPVPARQVSRVLEQGGARLRPAAGTVIYARGCRFRGHTVPHLVVRTEVGPVALLVLRYEPVAAPVDFKGGGFSGRIVPSGPGSLVVAGADGVDVDRVVRRMQDAVEWP